MMIVFNFSKKEAAVVAILTNWTNKLTTTTVTIIIKELQIEVNHLKISNMKSW